MKKFLTTVLICCLLFSILYSRPASAALIYIRSYCEINCTYEYGYENGYLYCYYYFDVLGPEHLSDLYFSVLADSSTVSRYTIASTSMGYYNVENIYDSSGNVTNTIYTLRTLYSESYDSIYGKVIYFFDGYSYSLETTFEQLNDIPEEPTETPTPTPEPTETPTPTPEPTETPTPTPEPTKTPTPTPKPTETPTPTPEPTETPTPTPEPTKTSIPAPSPTPTIGPEMILDVTLNENIATVDYCTGGYTPVLSYIELYEIAGYEMLLERDQFTSGTGTRIDTLQAGKTYRYKLTYTFDDNASRYTRELWSNDIYISDPVLDEFQQNGKIYNFRTLVVYVWDNVMSVKFPIEGFQIEWKTIFIWTLIAGGLIWFIKKVI